MNKPFRQTSSTAVGGAALRLLCLSLLSLGLGGLAACGADDAASAGDDDHDHDDGIAAVSERTVAPEARGEAVGGDAYLGAAGEGTGDEAVHLTREQVAAVGIGYGVPREMKVNDFVRATGTLGLPPNAYLEVTPPAEGFLRETRKVVEGEYLRRGTRIAYLENPEFIEHQRAYLEAAAELVFLQQELARQEELLAADAGVLKAVQRLRSEVAAKLANVEGLGQRLRYIGIATEGLTPASITSRVPLTLSRSGAVTAVGLRDGAYVRPETALLEVIDEAHLHLELSVFESDIGAVAKGQRVSYQVPALGPDQYEAEIQVIGKRFDDDNKTVLVHAHPVGEQPRFVEGLFVEARIWLDDESVEALPEEAIFSEGEVSYVFVGAEAADDDDEVEFERVRVQPGATDGGFTAVRFLDVVPAGMRVVTEGAYFVYAQSQAGALEHDH